MKAKTIRVPAFQCPNCGYDLDAVTHANGIAFPSPGDLSVCIGCATILEFGERHSLQACGVGKLEEVRREDPEAFALLQIAIDAVKRKRTL